MWLWFSKCVFDDFHNDDPPEFANNLGSRIETLNPLSYEVGMVDKRVTDSNNQFSSLTSSLGNFQTVQESLGNFSGV